MCQIFLISKDEIHQFRLPLVFYRGELKRLSGVLKIISGTLQELDRNHYQKNRTQGLP
jgi:hypothetical protein